MDTVPGEPDGLLKDGTWTRPLSHDARVEVPGGTGAPQLARAALREELDDRVPHGVLASLGLLTSELVTNAVRHGGADEDEQIVMHIGLTHDEVRVEICDEGPGFVAELPRPYGEGGYGLFLVAQVAKRWGVTGDGGAVTWFELDLEPQLA